MNDTNQESEALEKADITQYSSPDVEVVSIPQHQDYEGFRQPLNTLDGMIDTSQMRTHRLPEDDEGMTDFNQIPSRMPQSLLDALDGKTADNPDGTSQLVTIRLKNELIARLKNYAKQNEIGYPTYLIEDILEEFAKTHSLE